MVDVFDSFQEHFYRAFGFISLLTNIKARMATNLSSLNLSAPSRRSLSGLQFTWPGEEDVYFEPDKVVKMTWTPAIKDGSWGTLDMFEKGNAGASLRIHGKW